MYYDRVIKLDTNHEGESIYEENQITGANGKVYSLDFLSEKAKFGKGGNSSVFKVINPDGSSDKVAKFSNLNKPRKDSTRSYRKKYGRFIREIEVLKNLKNQGVQNIVIIIEDGLKDIGGYDHPYYIMEKADTDLTDYIIDNYPDIDIQTKLTLFYEIVKSLKSLHSMDYYHRDIKPDNIFMFKEGDGDEAKYVWKVGDLGLIGERTRNNDYIGEKIGPFGWLSPEAMNKYLTEEAGLGFDCEIDFKSDVFQLGKLFWFIIQGNVPIGQLLVDDLIQGEPVKNEVYNLIFEMLRYNKPARIELDNVLVGLESMRTIVPF
jgi:serine/threonine protein kinase